VQPERHEYPRTHHIPVRQSPFVNPHRKNSGLTASFSQSRPRRAEARRQGGSPAPQGLGRGLVQGLGKGLVEGLVKRRGEYAGG
jgi:hypothetical protein